MNRQTNLVVCVLVVLVAWSSPALAQSRGSITGSIKDTRQAPFRTPYKVRNIETGAVREESPAEDGTFVLGGLVPGTYEVSVTGEGFKPFSQRVVVVAGGTATLAIVLEYTLPDFVAVPDRWRLRFPIWKRYQDPDDGEYPFVPNRGRDPYDQNVLKGDLPIKGNHTFFVLSGIVETPLEYRSLPTPSGVSTERPGSEEFFGSTRQLGGAANAVLSLELFHGNTAFKPRDWAIKITPQFQVNYARTQERGTVVISPAEPTSRRRNHLALQEAFGELKLFDVSPNYDFVSVRAGIQPFNSDFRGFLFRDTTLGVRLFGTARKNKHQWNLMYLAPLEKETNSELNLTHGRGQRVAVANYYIQDFLTPGYTISASFHANRDHGEEFFFDTNGFLVRPSPIGLIAPHKVDAYYAGFAGDGHWGKLNLTHQFYQAFGTDHLNGISGQSVRINAQFAALELSVDKDWYRPRLSFMWASGDADPLDDQAKGFDAIAENPNFAGGPFSFWNRQGVRLAQTGVGLVGRSTLLPALRSSKSEGQSNFVNPGLFLYGVGFDAELTPKLRLTTSANYLQFHHVEPLQQVLFQDSISRQVGLDLGIGLQYRPALNDNIAVTGGFSMLKPGQGFRDILTSGRLMTSFVLLSFAY